MNFHKILVAALLLATWQNFDAKAQEYLYEKIPLPKAMKSTHIDLVYKDFTGVFWFSSGSELWKYDRPQFINFGAEADLKLMRITGIGQTSDSTICVTTAGTGIFLIKGESHKQLNSTNGLRSDVCNKLFIDEQDNLWVATDYGLNKIKLTSNDNFEISSFTKFNGLPGNKILDVYMDDGKLWVVTSRGSTIYLQKKMDLNTTPLDVFIRRIRIDYADTTLQSKYELDDDIKNIQIYFGVRGKNFRGPVRYRYKMLGLDTKWVHTSMSSVQYVSLPPKSYTFLLNAQNEDGFWGKVPATVEFVISEPYFQRWWFKALLVNFVGIILLLFYFLRIRQIKQVETEKTRLNKQISEIELKALRAQMNPHFIFNSLNSIQHFITNNDQESANKYLSKFAQLMRMILESSKKLTISVTDEVKALSFYMELESLRFDDKFDYSIDLDEEIDAHNTEIPTMLIQPYIENAIWHGLMNKDSKGMIKIELKLEGEAVKCVIEDNGIGRKKARELKKGNLNQYKSVGMMVTQERLEILNALLERETSVNIIDLEDENKKPLGTKVEIYIPVS